MEATPEGNTAAGERSGYVLGVNGGPHDNSAALLRDGELVAMVEEERLSGKRRSIGEPPRKAIAACLAEEGIALDAVAEIAVGWDIPLLAEIEGVDFDEREFVAWLLGHSGAEPRPPLRFVNHHLAHAASALYTSGFDEAAILVLDGRGESVATTLAVGGPGGIEVIETWGPRHSLGHLYGTAAAWTGLTVWGAGKLMGLAAYGKPDQPAPLTATADGYEIENAPPPGLPIASQLEQLSIRLIKGFNGKNFPFGRGDPAEPMAHADFAASVQAGTEDSILRLAQIARRETGHCRLVLAGGVALNCAANGSLIRSGIFDEVWIPPFPHDAGVSLGAAFVAARGGERRPREHPRLPHAFWAPTPAEPEGELPAELSACEVSRHDDAELADLVAQALSEGRLVGWWQGRAEVGQRALGARSILCDPRKRQMLVRANLVKGRETWRPLAPAVLAEEVEDVFDGPLPAAADFMLTAWSISERARSRMPAAVHVDGSARPQVVRPTQPRYHGVIQSFYERTGVPAVINTSFNLAGEPIVLTARDAARTFLASELDLLVLGNLIVRRPSAGSRGIAPAADASQAGKSSNFFVPWSGGRRSRGG